MVRVTPLLAPPLDKPKPVARIQTTAMVDADTAYLINLPDVVFGGSDLVMVVHPSVPRAQYPEILSALLKQRDEHERRRKGGTA